MFIQERNAPKPKSSCFDGYHFTELNTSDGLTHDVLE